MTDAPAARHSIHPTQSVSLYYLLLPAAAREQTRAKAGGSRVRHVPGTLNNNNNTCTSVAHRRSPRGAKPTSDSALKHLLISLKKERRKEMFT